MVRVLFWLLVMGVAVATLGPIGLRPESGFSPNVERFAAFFVVSGLFTFGYPDRPVRGWLALLAVAALLEALQNAVPGRHGRLLDFEVKALGTLSGAAVTMLAMRLAALATRR